MPLSSQNRLTFNLSAQREAEITAQTIEDMITEMQEDIMRAFPHDQLPGTTKGTPEFRREYYVGITGEYDRPLLMDDDYLVKLRDGLAPLPMSPFWRQLTVFPDIDREIRNDYIKLMEEA